MPLNDKQKRNALAIVRKLKKDKGFTIKQSELLHSIDDCKERQKKIKSLKNQAEEAGLTAVAEEMDENHKKLQSIIDDINEYMSILHPEGLLDYGAGPTGKVMGQG